MNEEEYKSKFERFLKEDITDAWKEIDNTFYKDKPYKSLDYFHNHFPRFRAMIELLEKNNVHPKFVAELGSFYPYTSLYFSDFIALYDFIGTEYQHDGIILFNYNINTIKDYFLSNYDLIILSEVLEHLPVSIFALTERIAEVMDDNAYLIVTYPLGGTNAKDYDKIVGDPNVSYGEHLREFTEDTTELFFKDLKKVDESYVNYPAYGLIKIILYQKVKQ